MPPKVTPQVPGEPTTSTETTGGSTNEAIITDQAVQMSGETGAPDKEAETVAVPKAQLEALMSRLEALEKTAPQPSQKVANPEALLPDQDTIDPAKIKIPVLSKQGWVVPLEFGTPPVAKK